MNIRKIKEYAINSYIYNTYYHEKVDEGLVYLESRDGNDFTGNILRIAEELSKGKYGEFRIVVYAKENVHEKIRHETLENGLKSIKAVNQEGISKYFGADFWQWHFDVGENNLGLIKRALPQMEYEIVNVVESEYGGIYGTVRITAIDLGMEWVDVQQRLYDWEQAMDLEGLEISYEGRTSELYRIFNSELDDTGALRYKTSEITIEAWCSLEGYWTLSRSDELLRAIFGTITWGYGMG